MSKPSAWGQPRARDSIADVLATTDSTDDSLCKFFKAGCCKFGAACRYKHVKHLLDADISRASGQPMALASPSPHSPTHSDLQGPPSTLNRCAICSEAPTKYGLLENCTHVFCLTCIREWRKQTNQQCMRSCPVCRVDSHLIIPADKTLNSEEKDIARTQYQQHLSSIPCKYGADCPFGTSCFYMHATMSLGDSKFRVLLGADGKKTGHGRARLSDWL